MSNAARTARKPHIPGTANMILHVYDYIFAFGVIFAFFDAWNIGTSTLEHMKPRLIA
jgi:hypothetical protein